MQFFFLSLSPLVVFVPASPGCEGSSRRKVAAKKKIIISDHLTLSLPLSLHYLM